MADKKAIELGKRLHRLMENEDFAPFLAEIENRIAQRKAQQSAASSTYDAPQQLAANLGQRIDELVSLREWLDDEIERGGRERMKELNENAPAEVPA